MVVANDSETIDQSSSKSVEKTITNGAAVPVSSPLGTSNDKKIEMELAREKAIIAQ